MTVLGFHASHEQVHPAALLEAVQHAEQVGFTAALCSDHFSPWSVWQGHSAFAWSWLGAAPQATDLPFGVINAPSQRYHPAIIARAAATLASMYPGRFWAALRTGEASNEHITGQDWPRKEVRNARLGECVDVVCRLFTGEEVSHDGLVTMDRAKLWTLPPSPSPSPPPLIGAAVSEQTAGWVAGWTDGLITVAQPYDDLRAAVDTYRGAGGTGPDALQVDLSWAPTEDEALAIAHQWRSNVFPPDFTCDVDHVKHFDAAAEYVPPEALRGPVLLSSDPAQHVAWLQELIALGFDEAYLHHVGKKQSAGLDVFGEKVLPQLDVTAKVAA